MEKSWGSFKPLYRDDRLEVVEIEVVAGGFSSPHLHRTKANTFIVLEGLLEVREFSNRSAREFLAYEVCPDKPLTIPAGVRHQFIARTPVKAIEVYHAYPDSTIDPHDIVRFGENGVDPAYQQ